MRVIHSRAKECQRLAAISALSWSTPASGLASRATSHVHPYDWRGVLVGVGDSAFERFLALLTAASDSSLCVDTLTAMDFAADTTHGRAPSIHGSHFIPTLVELPPVQFRFLVTVGHCSSQDAQDALVTSLVDNLPSTDCAQALAALWDIRSALGVHDRDKTFAPHYVADVVARSGVHNVVSMYGGAHVRS